MPHASTVPAAFSALRIAALVVQLQLQALKGGVNECLLLMNVGRVLKFKLDLFVVLLNPHRSDLHSPSPVGAFDGSTAPLACASKGCLTAVPQLVAPQGGCSFLTLTRDPGAVWQFRRVWGIPCSGGC